MTDWPTISRHAARRLHERGQACEPPVGPRAAWIDGQPVAEPHGLDADAVRYHAPTGLVLVCQHGVLVTCLRGETAASPVLRRAVQRVGGASA